MSKLRDFLRARLPRSIAARGAVFLLLVVMAVAMPGFVAHWMVASADRAGQQHAQESFLGAALSAYLENAAVDPAQDAEWIEQIEELGQRVRWAAIVDESGTGLEFRRRTAIPREELIAQIELTADEPQARPLRLGHVPSKRFELVTIPQPGQNATFAVVLDRGPDALVGDRTAVSLIVLAGVALAGVGLAWAWFHYTIDTPIRTLRRTARDVQAGLSEMATCGTLPDELAALARSAGELHNEMRKWQGEAKHWRRSVETAVDSRTREARQAQRRAERRATTDVLTGLGSRRLLEQNLPELMVRQKRDRRELSLVMLDVDHFKQVNDTCGHATGDEILVFLGGLIQAAVRKGTDLAARVGGDEFVLVLPGATTSEAADVAGRLNKLFAQRVSTFTPIEPPPSLSAGVASMRADGAKSWQELVELADQAMYIAKRSRRGVATVRDVRMARR